MDSRLIIHLTTPTGCRKRLDRVLVGGRKDNMGWSGWEKFRNLTPNDKTNLQAQK
jgi:hypothetical protein